MLKMRQNEEGKSSMIVFAQIGEFRAEILHSASSYIGGSLCKFSGLDSLIRMAKLKNTG